VNAIDAQVIQQRDEIVRGGARRRVGLAFGPAPASPVERDDAVSQSAS
jgi:hypothetical protein